MVHIIAFDAAGNETESEKVRFYIIHKPKEEEEEKRTRQVPFGGRSEDLLAAFRGSAVTAGLGLRLCPDRDPCPGGDTDDTSGPAPFCDKERAVCDRSHTSITTGKIIGRRLVCSYRELGQADP